MYRENTLACARGRVNSGNVIESAHDRLFLQYTLPHSPTPTLPYPFAPLTSKMAENKGFPNINGKFLISSQDEPYIYICEPLK